MNCYVVVFVFGLCIFCIQAQFQASSEESENEEIAKAVKLKALQGEKLEKVKKYAEAYAASQMEANSNTQIEAELPKGIICLFALGLDEENKKELHLIKLEEDGKDIHEKEVSLVKFVFNKPNGLPTERTEDAKIFIKSISSPEAPHLENGEYEYVAYAHFPFSSDGEHKGNYTFFAVFYSKEE